MKKLIILIGIAAMFSCTKVKCYTCNYEGPRYKNKKEVICDMNKRELKAYQETKTITDAMGNEIEYKCVENE